MITENYRYVRGRIDEACRRAGRNPQDVTLIAVSKTKPVSMIEELLPEGVLDFGENKPQELKEKYELLPKNLRFHMIGHLQRNKVKYIIERACMIHSVDSLRLAETIQEEAAKHDRIMPVLVEINIAQEESKFGLTAGETANFVREIAKFPNLCVKGLMTIAPFVENPEDNRVHFRNLYNLFIDIKAGNIDNVDMCILSMGMTNDYEVAVEEGATHVRVGTGIFGVRNYQ
ncbi:MAG: YggS family pyridoxal phosphate-dependent enzyme [Marvinbryantia sp.]|uniref:YggS family pyridoxal phosphate-dependent enzyme n=1 Tax=Marvinbryantia sp. TaxID=2496532 RepID=UPI0025E8169D|nr:YggS family pyridoxal phosphate-dependent enzyme [uncultured Marvinbryantia sp.]